MKPSDLFAIEKERIKSIAARCGAKRIGIFGSVARGDDRENSDFDFYVEIDSFWELCGLQNELQELLKRRVDVVAPGMYKDETIAENARKEMLLI